MSKVTVFNKIGLTGLIRSEETIHEIIIPFINAEIGNDWSVEFREYATAFGLKIIDVYIEAGIIPEYLIIQKIIDDRLSNEFVMVGRDVEYTGIKCTFIFHWGTIHYRYPEFNFVPQSFLANLPPELVYAALLER